MLRIDSDLHRRAKMLAAATGKSLNALVAETLVQRVESELPLKTSSQRRAG